MGGIPCFNKPWKRGFEEKYTLHEVLFRGRPICSGTGRASEELRRNLLRSHAEMDQLWEVH